MCGSQGSFIRLLQVHSGVLPCLWAASEASCLQKGHWLLCMQGSGCELEKRNRLNLMRPSSLTQEKEKCACVREKKKLYEWEGVCGAYAECLCVMLGVSVCDFHVCGKGRGYFNSCYILWQQCDSTFRSVQTMWLTQHCSPQPQCKLHFLKPVPRLYGTV